MESKLIIIKEVDPRIRPNGAKRRMCLVRCECGNESIKALDAVKSGSIKQCWTCAHETASLKRQKHGLCKHKLYGKWRDMLNRCYNENVDRYACYGGRGITVCDEWKVDFKSFYDWCISNGWKTGLSIERLDVNGNYCPINCTLIPIREQMYNKRNTFRVPFNGELVSLSKLLDDRKLSKYYKSIWQGMKFGKTFDYFVKKYSIS